MNVASIALKRVVARIESGVSVNAVDTPATAGDAGVLKTSCVYTGNFDAGENKAVLPEELERVACSVKKDRLIVSRMNTPDLVGAAGLVDADNESLFLPDRLWQVEFRTDLVSPRFVYWWTRSNAYRDQVRLACAGASSSMQNLDQDSFGSFEILIPRIDSQQRIANFLDEQTARIDALIAEKERLLERLHVFRKAVISEATTRGLHERAATRPSGLEWLGEIPAHWQLKRLKHLGQAIIGLTYSPDDVTEAGQGVLVLRSSNVQDGRIALDDNVYVTCSIPESLRVRAGDILICSRNGSRALIGKNAVITPELAGVTFGAFMTVFRSPANFYIRWLLNSPLFYFHSASFMTSTINQLTTGNLNSLVVPLPPMEERRQIDVHLSARTGEIELLCRHTVEHIDRLREYRSSLISAAVTGQLDLGALDDKKAA